MRGLLLLSGGIDSPVAGYLMLRRGARMEALHFTYEPASPPDTVPRCIRICETLGIPRLHILPAGRVFGTISRTCDIRLYFVLAKRAMLRMAERVASGRFDHLVTGESIGQVSSQTLRNLAVIDPAVTLPVVRPLIWMDKQEIIDLAKRIGTYEISLGPEMCDMFGPDRPRTRASLDEVLAEEAKLEGDDLIERIITREVRSLSPSTRAPSA